jgi:hypothetical protein
VEYKAGAMSPAGANRAYWGIQRERIDKVTTGLPLAEDHRKHVWSGLRFHLTERPGMRKICCDRPPERVWGTLDLTPLLPERSAIYGLAKCLPITKAGLSSNKDARIWTGQKVIFGVRTPVGIVALGGWQSRVGSTQDSSFLTTSGTMKVR